MTSKSEWQEANRELIAEQRRALGDPPTAEDMLAFSRGELSESEEERIRDLIVVYPELARMYNEPFPEEGEPVSDESLRAGWEDLQQRLQKHSDPGGVRQEAQRGRVVFMRYVPAAIAAMLAVVFFGLFVRAEKRARYFADVSSKPRVLGVSQELLPDANRGPGGPTPLQAAGDVYLLKPRLIGQMRYPHYQIELHDANGAKIWEDRNAQAELEGETEVFRLVVPCTFLRAGEPYQLRILGLDAGSPRLIGVYDVSAPAE